jgi:hypothetical protein
MSVGATGESMLLWLLSGVAAALALLAVIRVGRLARRLQRMSQSYWELRYEHDQLRSRVERPAAAEPHEDLRETSPPASTFVPLSSIRR